MSCHVMSCHVLALKKGRRHDESDPSTVLSLVLPTATVICDPVHSSMSLVHLLLGLLEHLVSDHYIFF